MPFSKLEKAAEAKVLKCKLDTDNDDEARMPAPKRPAQAAKWQLERQYLKEVSLPTSYQAIIRVVMGGLWQCPVVGCRRRPEDPITRQKLSYRMNSVGWHACFGDGIMAAYDTGA